MAGLHRRRQVATEVDLRTAVGEAQRKAAGGLAVAGRQDVARHGVGQVVAIDQPAPVIDDDQTVAAAVVRGAGDEGFEEAQAVLALLVRERLLDLAGGGGDQGRVVRAEDVRRAREVDDAEDGAVDRVADRRAGAGPGLDPHAEMFGRVHVDGFARQERGADPVGADDVLGPLAADGEVDVHALAHGRAVADDVDQDALGVGERQHRARAVEQAADAGERPARGVHQFAVGVAAMLDLGLPALDRRMRAVGVGAAAGATGPGLADQGAHGGSGAVRTVCQQGFPGPHRPAFVIVEQRRMAHRSGGPRGRPALVAFVGNLGSFHPAILRFPREPRRGVPFRRAGGGERRRTGRSAWCRMACGNLGRVTGPGCRRREGAINRLSASAPRPNDRPQSRPSARETSAANLSSPSSSASGVPSKAVSASATSGSSGAK